jgi:hypothetical protein
MPKGVGYSSSNVIAGAGLDLNYVGNHVFAFSGGITTLAGNADATMLDMVTGSEYIVGDFVFFAAVDPNLTGGSKTQFKLTLNGIKVVEVDADTSQEDMQTYIRFPIIIPPYTNVKVVNEAAGDGFQTYATFSGRAYK